MLLASSPLRRLSLRARLRFPTMSLSSSLSNSSAPAPTANGTVLREPRIVQYYLKQGVFDAAQLEEIKTTLNAPLPSCFRVNPNAPDAASIQAKLAGEFQHSFDDAQWNGVAVPPPRELSWYPIRHGAWQLDSGKNALGKAAREHEGVRAFRDFLLYETNAGTITRQEAVSMVPAMLLGIQRKHLVLDLCAAPGSKTSQVMENLSSNSTEPASASVEPVPNRQGFIVANDANEKRGYMLVHQLQRLGLDTAVVTCHLGQHFPGLFVNGQLQQTNVFDRVICDVPCTGDGTIRKNRNIWSTWLPGGALTLHAVQLELALRAAALLKPEGLMVYSTCSFNPLENEAIVAELLRRADGALEIVDATDMLPGLIRRPGMTQWETAWLSRENNAELEWFSTYDEVPKSLKGFRICKSMFPPDDETIRASLRHSMRLFPTDQNTGGFFVTLLRKKHALPGEKEVGLPSYEAATPRRPHPENREFKCRLCGDATHTLRNCPKSYNGQRLARQKQEKLENEAALALQPKAPLHGYTTLAAEHWEVIKDFYGIHDDFPSEHLCSRSDGATSICLVNEHVQATCLQGTDLRVLNTGVRCFAKVVRGASRVFRATEEGLAIVLPFLTKRILSATYDDLAQLLASSVGGAVTNDCFSRSLQEAAAAMETLSGVGPVVLVLTTTTTDKAETDETTPFALPIWLGAKSLGLLVDKGAQQQLQEALARRASRVTHQSVTSIQ